jgi:hypothetical protein
MLKFIIVGLVGCGAALGGVMVKKIMDEKSAAAATAGENQQSLTQIKTEMTGIPVITQGQVAGYLVFQISSTVDSSKLPSPEFEVSPYLLDAAVRAGFQSMDDGIVKYNAAFLEHLTETVKRQTNQKLSTDAIVAVNVEAFNYIPKEDIRGNFLKNTASHDQH